MNSFNFNKGMGDNECVYPFTEEQIKNLKKCRLVNPKVGDNHGLIIPKDFDILKATNEVIQVRLDVERGIFPMWFMQKYYPFREKFGEYEFPKEILGIEGLSIDDPRSLANVVHMDSPNDMPKTCLTWLTNPMYEQGVNVKSWTPNYINFLETIPYVEEQIADGVKRALIKAFEVKYFFGLIRPENVWEEISGFDGKKLTAYPEGCPNHSSFVAGHASAAAGGVSSLMNQMKNLKDCQEKKLIDTAYSWAMFRTLAGVHFHIDNIGGLMINGLEKFMDKDIIKLYKG